MLLNFDLLAEKYKFDIKGILHIGAHFGQEMSIYERYHVKNVMMFEPLIHTFNVLKKNMKGKAILVNKALGNENKKVQMFVEQNNQGMSSSVLKPEKHLTQYPWIKFTHKLIVDMVRLDDVEFKREDYNFINIDVQGYELEVFKGGAETLNHIDYIISEVNKDEVYKDCARVEQLDEFLGTYGFDRIETTWDGGTWGDALYVKNK